MHYYSTRGKVEPTAAAEVILQGLAPDGGLYVPAEKINPFLLDDLPAGNYRQLASAILKPFLSGFSPTEVDEAVELAYSAPAFDHQQVTPLHFLAGDLSILELWHGPTSAFKDIALQLLPHLISSAIKNGIEKRELVILTATSGDTGKSALEGFRDVPGTRIYVFFPEQGVSEIQKLQMVTQEGANVFVTAVRGNFDQAQAGVKKIFNDHRLVEKLSAKGFRLSSANSINWGRLIPQVVYYFFAYLNLAEKGSLKKGEPVNFVVPTGNFGNILAGYYAQRLGLPVNRLICAANSNNVLADFFASGRYDCRRSLHRTISPSMDILISSNLERLLFELTNHDSEKIADWMKQLGQRGTYDLDRETKSRLQELLRADYATDEETLQTIASVYAEHNYLIDPHTAVGMAVFRKYIAREMDKCPTVLLATASPFKFASSVVRSLDEGAGWFRQIRARDTLAGLSRKTGKPIPPGLSGLENKPVIHKQVIAPDKMSVYLRETLLTGA